MTFFLRIIAATLSASIKGLTNFQHAGNNHSFGQRAGTCKISPELPYLPAHGVELFPIGRTQQWGGGPAGSGAQQQR